jgi:hypothetical protein
MKHLSQKYPELNYPIPDLTPEEQTKVQAAFDLVDIFNKTHHTSLDLFWEKDGKLFLSLALTPSAREMIDYLLTDKLTFSEIEACVQTLKSISYKTSQ